MALKEFLANLKKLIYIEEKEIPIEEVKPVEGKRAPVEVINGLEFFPEPRIEITPEAVAKAVERARYKTKVYTYNNKQVIGELIVVNERWGGAVSEILFQSDSTVGTVNKDYSVEIIADGLAVYNDSWDNFNAVSNYMQDLTAFDDGSYYILTFNTIFFESSIFIRIYNASSPTFTKIFAKIIQRII